MKTKTTVLLFYVITRFFAETVAPEAPWYVKIFCSAAIAGLAYVSEKYL